MCHCKTNYLPSPLGEGPGVRLFLPSPLGEGPGVRLFFFTSPLLPVRNRDSLRPASC